MWGMLVAYDADGTIIATLDQLVVLDANEHPIGLFDFATHEANGGKFRLGPDRTDGVWNVPGAVGSGVWPEWLGAHAHNFRVQTQNGRITHLIHKESGHKRTRSTIEAAIAKRIKDAPPDDPPYIGDLVGGPGKPMLLDGDGKTTTRPTHTPPGGGRALAGKSSMDDGRPVG